MGPSSPYYLFGSQRRYPYAWHGGAGGVPMGFRSSESRELGIFDLVESGASAFALPSPALSRTRLHAVGDWPLVRPAGPEPQIPGDLGFELSRNEMGLVAVGVLGLVALGAFAEFSIFKRLLRSSSRPRSRAKKRRSRAR